MLVFRHVFLFGRAFVDQRRFAEDRFGRSRDGAEQEFKLVRHRQFQSVGPVAELQFAQSFVLGKGMA